MPPKEKVPTLSKVEKFRRESLLQPLQIPHGNQHQSTKADCELKKAIALIIKKRMVENRHLSKDDVSEINQAVHEHFEEKDYVLVQWVLDNWQPVQDERTIKKSINNKTYKLRQKLAKSRSDEQKRQMEDEFPHTIPVDADDTEYSNYGTKWMDSFIHKHMEAWNSRGEVNFMYDLKVTVENEDGGVIQTSLWDLFLQEANKTPFNFYKWKNFDASNSRWGKWIIEEDQDNIEEFVGGRFYKLFRKKFEVSTEPNASDDTPDNTESDATNVSSTNEYSSMSLEQLEEVHRNLKSDHQQLLSAIATCSGHLVALPLSINPLLAEKGDMVPQHQQLAQIWEKIVQVAAAYDNIKGN
ncbi:MAG: hypothetical protein SGILL_009437 [Bacillariaceae sp.]